MSPSAIEEGSDMTDESLRAVGDSSSLTGGEMGVMEVLSLRDDFLLENSDGFLPKMEALGAGDGSGISLFVPGPLDV